MSEREREEWRYLRWEWLLLQAPLILSRTRVDLSWLAESVLTGCWLSESWLLLMLLTVGSSGSQLRPQLIAGLSK